MKLWTINKALEKIGLCLVITIDEKRTGKDFDSIAIGDTRIFLTTVKNFDKLAKDYLYRMETECK